MTLKPYARLYFISLMITGLTGLTLSLCSLFSWPLPDWAARLLGVLALIALPCLIFSFVKTYIKKT